MDELFKRAWIYCSRTGWQQSMTMLRRKIDGTAPIPTKAYLDELETATESGVSVAQPDPKKLPAFDTVGHPGAIFPYGIVAIIGDLNLPQCKKYRVIQKVEVLALIGIQAKYSYWGDTPRAMSIMQCASAVIFYRMKDNTEFNVYLAEAHRLGIPAGYDIDDPVFDNSVYGTNPNLQYLKADERASLLSETESYRRAMTKCEFVITSTPALKELASQSCRFVYVWRNAVDVETRHWAQVAVNNRVSRTDGSVVLGYASGSRAHEADFRLIEKPLLTLLKRFDNVSLAVSGYLDLPESLVALGHRVSKFPFTTYNEYLAGMAQTDINIVPLVADCFNASKSAIRFLEAAVVGVPTVASRVGDFVNLIAADRTGLLVDSEEEWIDRLSELISDDTVRRRMGFEARLCALTNFTTDVVAHGLDDALQSRFKKSVTKL